MRRTKRIRHAAFDDPRATAPKRHAAQIRSRVFLIDARALPAPWPALA
jgi:hypothetical protein